MGKKHKVLSVGADLSSNGGIASVVKVLYNVKNKKYNYTLLKTSYYKDKGLVFELQIAIKAIIKYFLFLISNQFSIIHIHSSSRISFYRKSIFLLLAKLFRRNTILQIHSSDFDDFFINTKGIKKTFIKLILSQPDKIFVLCNDWKNKIREKYSLNTEVIYNPINLEPIQANRPKPKPLNILFLGFFIPSKGIDDLLKVIKYYKNSKEVSFIIGGKGDLETTIKKTIHNHQLDNVNFIGWANEEMKNKIFNETDVLFLPSFKEGMPIVILEAISHSIPVISTNIAGISELVVNEHNGFIYRPGDIDSFIKAIDFFINCSEVTYNQFRHNSRQIANNFSDEIIVEQIESIYTSLL
jgi:glycosyltransferase involved in cell wall biosynthesis